MELTKAEISEEYAEKFNIRIRKFKHLYINDKKVSDTLYRVGDLGLRQEGKYCLLLKQVESRYSPDIDENESLHLAQHWCIIDTETGEEKQVFDKFTNVYLQGGVVYVIDKKYYHIETGELLCSGQSAMNSSDYIFVDQGYRDGVVRITKETGKINIYN